MAIDPERAAGWAEAIVARHLTLAAALAAGSAGLAALVNHDPRAVALLLAHRRAMLFGLRERALAGPIVATRYELIAYCRHRMAHDRNETLRVFFLNARRELIVEEVLGRGGPDGVAVEPRQILARALEVGATGLVLVHNHPSGDPAPSGLDRRFTRRLAQAGDALGIALHDHLIVARDGEACVAMT